MREKFGCGVVFDGMSNMSLPLAILLHLLHHFFLLIDLHVLAVEILLIF